MCETVAKQICSKCGKGIYNRVISITKEGKIPIWNNIIKNWDNVEYYHPICILGDNKK